MSARKNLEKKLKKDLIDECMFLRKGYHEATTKLSLRENEFSDEINRFISEKKDFTREFLGEKQSLKDSIDGLTTLNEMLSKRIDIYNRKLMAEIQCNINNEASAELGLQE